MYLTQRQVALGLQLVVNFGLAAITLIDALNGYSPVLTNIRVICLIVAVAAMIAYWRGWRYAPHTIVALAPIITALATSDGHYDPTNGLALTIPALFAVILGRFFWVLAVAVATPLLMVLMSGSSEWNNEVGFFIVYTMVTVGLALSRQVFDTATQQARDAARRAEELQAHAESQAVALGEANAAQQAQLEEQRRLLDLVATLETPAVTLADGVLFAPIVGQLDSRRSAALTARLLEAAHNGQARQVIIDISGVAAVDSAVAATLLTTARSLRLLGCRVALTGIAADVALTLAQQGVIFDEVTMARAPQDVLARA